MRSEKPLEWYKKIVTPLLRFDTLLVNADSLYKLSVKASDIEEKDTRKGEESKNNICENSGIVLLQISNYYS